MVNILLTGSSRGIGAAIANVLSDENLVGHATRSGIPADFDEPGAPAALWAEALDRLGGKIDVLINNAGIFEANPLDGERADWLAGWERTMRINLTAAAELCRLAVLHWQQ
ncbi:MAG: SDR family oxidoreductase, partial [Sphingomonas sp.]